MVSVRRTDSAGMVRPVTGGDRALQREGAGVGQFADFAGKLQADAARRQHHRGEAEADAELLELDRDVAVAVAADRHGEFAAGQELGGFAADGGQVGLGQHMHQADLLQRLEDALGVVGRRCWRN